MFFRGWCGFLVIYECIYLPKKATFMCLRASTSLMTASLSAYDWISSFWSWLAMFSNALFPQVSVPKQHRHHEPERDDWQTVNTQAAHVKRSDCLTRGDCQLVNRSNPKHLTFYKVWGLFHIVQELFEHIAYGLLGHNKVLERGELPPSRIRPCEWRGSSHGVQSKHGEGSKRANTNIRQLFINRTVWIKRAHLFLSYTVLIVGQARLTQSTDETR